MYKNTGPTERMPLLYNQGVIFMLCGEKRIYTESKNFTYNEDNFLVITNSRTGYSVSDEKLSMPTYYTL